MIETDGGPNLQANDDQLHAVPLPHSQDDSPLSELSGWTGLLPSSRSDSTQKSDGPLVLPSAESSGEGSSYSPETKGSLVRNLSARLLESTRTERGVSEPSSQAFFSTTDESLRASEETDGITENFSGLSEGGLSLPSGWWAQAIGGVSNMDTLSLMGRIRLGWRLDVFLARITGYSTVAPVAGLHNPQKGTMIHLLDSERKRCVPVSLEAPVQKLGAIPPTRHSLTTTSREVV